MNFTINRNYFYKMGLLLSMVYIGAITEINSMQIEDLLPKSRIINNSNTKVESKKRKNDNERCRIFGTNFDTFGEIQKRFCKNQRKQLVKFDGNITSLPIEIIKTIASYLTFQDLSPFEQTCHNMGRILRDAYHYQYLVEDYFRKFPHIIKPDSKKDLFLYLIKYHSEFAGHFANLWMNYIPTFGSNNFPIDHLWKKHLSIKISEEIYRLNKMSLTFKGINNQASTLEPINDILFSPTALNITQPFKARLGNLIRQFHQLETKQNQNPEIKWRSKLYRLFLNILPYGGTILTPNLSADTLIQDLSDLIQENSDTDNHKIMMKEDAQFHIEKLKSLKMTNDAEERDRLKSYFMSCKTNKYLTPPRKVEACLIAGTILESENNYDGAKNSYLEAYHHTAVPSYHKSFAAFRLAKLIILKPHFNTHENYVVALTYFHEVLNAQGDIFINKDPINYYLGYMAHKGWGEMDQQPDDLSATTHLNTFLGKNPKKNHIYYNALHILGLIQFNMIPPNYVAAREYYQTYFQPNHNFDVKNKLPKESNRVSCMLAHSIFNQENPSFSDLMIAKSHYQAVVNNVLSSQNERCEALLGVAEIIRRLPNSSNLQDHQAYQNYTHLITAISDKNSLLFLTAQFGGSELIRQNRVPNQEKYNFPSPRSLYNRLLEKSQLPSRIWAQVKLTLAELDRSAPERTQEDGYLSARLKYDVLIVHPKTPPAEKAKATLEKAIMVQHHQGIPKVTYVKEAYLKDDFNAHQAYWDVINNPFSENDTKGRAYLQLAEMEPLNASEYYHKALNFSESTFLKIEAQIGLARIKQFNGFDQPQSRQITPIDYDRFIQSNSVPHHLKGIAKYAKLLTQLMMEYHELLEISQDPTIPDVIMGECLFKLGEMNYLGGHTLASNYESAKNYFRQIVELGDKYHYKVRVMSKYYLARIGEAENNMSYESIMEAYKNVIEEYDAHGVMPHAMVDESLFNLAELYYKGGYFQQPNYEEAHKLYTRLNNLESKFLNRNNLNNSNILKIKPETSSKVIFRLAEINHGGFYVPINLTKALNLYQCALEYNELPSNMRELALLRTQEIQNSRKNIEENVSTNIQMAMKYYFGDGVHTDYSLCGNHLERVGDIINPNFSINNFQIKAEGIFLHGERYYCGNGVIKNINIALTYYQVLDKENLIQYISNKYHQRMAHFRLGYMWYKDFFGENGEIDYTKARKHFENAIEVKNIPLDCFSDWTHCYLAEMSLNKNGFKKKNKITISKHLNQVVVDNNAKDYAQNLRVQAQNQGIQLG